MKDKNHFGRLLVILLMTWGACIGLYWLPTELLGFSVRKVDLLSDIRVEPANASLDLPEQALETEEQPAPKFDSVQIRNDSVRQVVRRDSLYQTMASTLDVDSAQVRIEDFSPGHRGLSRFFAALNRIDVMNRPVRIAFWGDSFIEGDILVADFRVKMQEHFGGRGVGFVPVASEVEQYRPTIYQRSKGWVSHSFLSDHKYKYALPSLLFEPEADEASITFKTVNAYPGLDKVASLKFIYARNEQSEMRLICNDTKDTVIRELSPTNSITQYEMEGLFADGKLRFRNAKGLQALGIALEDNEGVVVDNFALRGNSGVTLNRLDENSCRALYEIRPYDLIVLQYGLNVASETVREYGWYRDEFVEVIRHVQQCFPETDILLLSVSDRSHYHEGAFCTMPSVVALMRAQRQAAEQAQVAFWNVYQAMGGENSMVRYVKHHWASKDYTHLSFRGGREIATALFDALILEMELYDEMEKTED